MLPPPMSSPNPFSIVVEFATAKPAVAGLLVAADHARFQAGDAADVGEQLAAVAGVADGARRERNHVLDARGLAERRKTAAVWSARSTRSGRSTPFSSSPAPIRTASRISSTRLHQGVPGSYPNTTRRQEFDPMSITASLCTGGIMHVSVKFGDAAADAVCDERHRTGICSPNNGSEARQPPRSRGHRGPGNRDRRHSGDPVCRRRAVERQQRRPARSSR